MTAFTKSFTVTFGDVGPWAAIGVAFLAFRLEFDRPANLDRLRLADLRDARDLPTSSAG
jgi:hypothetical protein